MMDSSNKESLASNPFLALFAPNFENRSQVNTISDQEQTITQQDSISLVSLKEQQKKQQINSGGTLSPVKADKDVDEQILNDELQKVFLVTLDNDSDRIGSKQVGSLPKRCVYLKDSAIDANGLPILSWSNIDQALMERLTMEHPRKNVVVTGGAHSTQLTAEIEAGESACMKYLTACYKRAYDESTRLKDKKPYIYLLVERAKSLAVSYAGTCLLSPEMFPNQDVHKQLFNLLVSSQDDRGLPMFLSELLKVYPNYEELNSIFSPIIFMLNENKSDITLFGPQVFQHLEIFTLFAKSSELAKLLVSCSSWLPPTPASFMGHRGLVSGRAFQNQTIIGPYLALTSISSDPNKPSEYFLRPSEQTQVEMQATMASLRTQIDSLSNKLHRFMFEMVKASPRCKHEVLRWIGACLHSNSARQKMMSELLSSTLAEDGFFLNMGTLMLKLCQPFLDPSSPKLLKINPRYCATVTNINMISSESTGIHSVGLEEETRLVISGDEQVKLRDQETFGFVTELFFMTHRCLQIGLWKVSEKYKKLMNDLGQLQRVYQEASSQGADNAVIGRLKTKFESGIIQQLSLKTHLLNPTMLELAMRFYIASASWLNQIALAGDDFEEMTAFRDVKLPLPSQTPAGLLFIPEFVIENMADFIIFLRHFSEDTLESVGASLHHIVTFFVIYIGSPDRIKNPHLRAKLAEALESLVPVRKGQEVEMEKSPIAMFHREQAFANHQEATEHLPIALLNLFVDIEFTGHSMEFEQKFGYRHHMYTVLEYIWSQPKYKQSLTKLSEAFTQDLTHMKKLKPGTKCSATPPLILRFFNLLVNDAVFLLDESLEFMAQLKKLQIKQDSGEVDSLPENQREAHLRELRQTGQMARSHNILASETVHALSYLTTEIKSPICMLACMANRMAGMLNYFLLHLVGPKMGNLKVKDFSEFHFKPQKLVSDIVDIYLNLGKDKVFVKAVAEEERSYSPELFAHAERVLKLIGRPADVIFKLNSLARKIAESVPCCTQELPEPPEEFKDPIMDTLMKDPMLLPTSGKIVDKDVICRHLLSDEKDPFNREPLSLADLTPATELKKRIHEWLIKHGVTPEENTCCIKE